MVIYTYLLKSLNNNYYYTGISKNPFQRLNEHNNGKLKITSVQKPFSLIYLKTHNSYAEARKHEKWLKKKNRIHKNKLAQLAPPVRGGVK